MHNNKIKILSADQAIKIAAGEVVERPSNIIKECLENSIDAGATKITIIVHQAGKSLIKIIDNGSGMNPDDAKLSVFQYATSKISTVEDLESIATFGFRGEALASINAVSKLTIRTKIDAAQTGTELSWNFGVFQHESLQSHPAGTTLEIAHLFDNIPARKKFLKKDETEWRSIVTLFQAFCLDYCNIHFQLYNEEKLQYNCPITTNLADRSAQLFDNNFQEKNINLVSLENKSCLVTGLISHPTYYRYDRNQIFIFVNQRWVKNIDLTKAIMRGYAGILPPQKFPSAIIFITINQDQVDVNIHPKKEEVKFLHPKIVEQVIVNSIKATLDKIVTDQTASFSSKKTYEILDYTPIDRPTAFSFLTTQAPTQLFQIYDQKKLPLSAIQVSPAPSLLTKQHKDIHDSIMEEKYQPITVPDFMTHAFEQSISLQKKDIQNMLDTTDEPTDLFEQHHEVAIIGQYKKTYILYEKNNSLVFIDQHAAHERILYEQFILNFNNIATIQLIFPEFIKLQKSDIVSITPYLKVLQEHGITAEIFSETQLVVQAVPVHLKNQLLQETIEQIIGWLSEINETDHDRLLHTLHEKIHAKMACSAAIKAGDSLNLQQMQELIKKLNLTQNRFSCPHGRPTIWVQPIEYIEKQFKRDYGKKAEQLYDFL